MFFNVGNDFSTSPTSSIITFGNDNNVSVSDMFERPVNATVVYARVRVTGSAASTGTLLQLGRYTRNSGRTSTLGNNQVNQTIFLVGTGLVKAFKMDYTIVRGTAIRHGTLTVSAQDGLAPLSYTEDYTENSTSGVTLSVTQVGSTIAVNYTTTNTGTAGNLTYSISNLA